jgi:serine/threonine protein kinase
MSTMKFDRIGKFQILGQLGRGAHSTILQIRREEDRRLYALKVVPIAGPNEEKFLVQARREFEAAQLLDHPNLVKVHALEVERDWLFRVRKASLLIEYVPGKPLDTVGRPSVVKLTQVFARVAAGLAHMHRKRVYHADLKPANVLLSPRGEVKIIDFGLAWIEGQPKDRLQGTPEYMAPEQARESVVDARTDIYNFGATMYRLVTMRYPPNPLAEASVLGLTAGAWRSLVVPVQKCCADASPELASLIERCLDFSPDARPASAADLRDELGAIASRLIRKPDDHLEPEEE